MLTRRVVPSLADPQSLNRYSYVLNNPLYYTDPSGQFGWIAAAIVGAIIGGTTAAVTGGNIWQGMALGAVSGTIFAGVGSIVGESITYTGIAGGVGPPTAGMAAAGQIVGGVAGGASAGAASAAITGGNIGKGALTGGIMGGLGSFGTPDYAPFGDSEAGSIGNRLFNSSLTGAAFGATYAGVTGGNIGQDATRGAMFWGLGEAAYMGIGHTVGLIGSGGSKPRFENGAFYYDAKGWESWVAFSNVVTGPYNQLDTIYVLPDGRKFSYREHELGHPPQGTMFGPAYGPAHIASLTVGGVAGVFSGFGFERGMHRFGLLERWYHPVPYYQ